MISHHDVKADLRVRHDADDQLIFVLTQSAIDECLRFMNRSELPVIPEEPPEDGEDPWGGDGKIAPSVYAAVFMLVQASYDRMKPEDVELRRRRAETLCMPYRKGLGL